ncbi:TIGR03089 family protein, partial [Actinomadura sp. KC345]|uniref:TIGR03089 family protein n=1 Tax=Actinomadura sp. KC345 TaxID=2530371 RepID=UPI00104EAD5A
ADDPSNPLVTFYDDASGERVELSARTFDNWVAKTANFLVDGLAAEPGTRAVLVLPPHWQTPVWLMACWSAGLLVEPLDPDAFRGRGATGPNRTGPNGVEPVGAAEPYILAAAQEVLDDVLTDEGLTGGAEEIVGLSLHALGGPLADCPPGVTDYAAEVRTYGDRFVPGPEVTPETPAMSVTNATLTGAELVTAGRAAAEKWELDARDRLLVGMPFATLDGVLTGLLAPLISGASVIIQRNFDKAALDRRVTVEHVTVVAGLPGWNDESGHPRRLT